MTTLAEALILLTDRGSSSSFSTVDRNTATVGATLVDLALAGRIDLSGKYVSVVDPAPTGNLLMDEVLAQIAAEKPRKPSSWISKLYWGFPNRVRDGLARRDVVNRTESGIFHVRKYTAVSPEAATEVRGRLREAVDAGHSEDEWVAALAELVRALGMFRQALPELPKEQAKAALTAIARESWATEATRQGVKNNRIAICTALIPVFVITAITFDNLN